MKVVEIKEVKAVKKFINMADDIYRGDKFYVPYMRRDLYKTLCALVLKHKTYTALAVERNGKFIARVLFTVGAAKRIEADTCGYFSHFECVNDVEVCKLLLEHIKNAKDVKNYILKESEEARRKRRTLNTLDIGSGSFDVDDMDD